MGSEVVLELRGDKPLPLQTRTCDGCDRSLGPGWVGAELRPTFQSVSTAKRKVSEFS